MSVYSKLQEARIRLQGMKLNKSGHNKFAGYQYFELGDFLPQVNQIFHDLKLCSITSYAVDLASLTIIDTEDCSQVVITSPMAEAALKGCHPIQNLGAVETYQRRYLYVAALEIVEHDAIDATTKKGTITPNDGAGDSLDQARKNYIADLAIVIKDCWEIDDFEKMYEEYLSLTELDEKTYLWSLLDSKIRAKIKLIGQGKKVNV